MASLRWLLAAGALLTSLCLGGLAAAQPGDQTFNTLRLVDTHPVTVRAMWSASAGSQPGRVTLSARSRTAELARGGFIRTATAVRGSRVLVAMVEGGTRPAVQLALVEIAADGAAQQPIIIRVPRSAGRRTAPTSVVACADPQGFTVLWQEQGGLEARDAVTFMARIDDTGRWLAKPTEVAVPWALGAVAHNGDGYHLAIFFDGSRPDQTRLCAVRLTAQGQPREHPWWVSSPQLIQEVQLMHTAGRMAAYFRGGPDGSVLQSTDITAVRQWGTSPPAPSSHGRLSATEEFFVYAAPNGKPAIVRQTL